MISFHVNDMTCGHCVAAITKAVQSIDQGAKVEIDLAAHRVQIEPARADAGELADAIREAGYTPVVDGGAAPQAANAAPRGGCCCG
jgi:copper chaperone